MTISLPECFWDVGAELGEGPMWHARTQTLYFVDIKKRRIYSSTADGARRKSWSAPQQPAFIVPSADFPGGDEFICALEDGLYRFSIKDGEFNLMRHVEKEIPSNRFNDGLVDRDGSLWFGSMDDGETRPSGALYHLNSQGRVQIADSDYVITNGPAQSPDGTILYHTDTLKKTIYAFDVVRDVVSGVKLTNRRVFATISGAGFPDGMAVDSVGCVWIALFGGSRIERYAASGELMSVVPFPCSNITKLAFGGDDLCTVFVTTARKGLLPKQLADQPTAGALFTFRVTEPGLPQYEFLAEAPSE